ncbi:hypothetical protein A0H81_13897 [Grifola frondosa]|uniref:Uncharacterized protein n=1 Tax=Grifola frondosa TaxID=5627 RepID=A0A1C7LTV3_GRIFR|nr:hypothetical protein A0H81_13897 [Grifola frondosa]
MSIYIDLPWGTALWDESLLESLLAEYQLVERKMHALEPRPLCPPSLHSWWPALRCTFVRGHSLYFARRKAAMCCGRIELGRKASYVGEHSVSCTEWHSIRMMSDR